MKSRLNKYLKLTVASSICATFLTGCAHLQKCDIPDDLGALPSGTPAILAIGTSDQIRQAAIADARTDVAARRPKIAITGGFAAWPVGVPEKYFQLVQSYPQVPLPCGCTSPWLQQAGIYAEAYNHEILPYLLSQNAVRH